LGGFELDPFDERIVLAKDAPLVLVKVVFFPDGLFGAEALGKAREIGDEFVVLRGRECTASRQGGRTRDPDSSIARCARPPAVRNSTQ
jgi:hypothetical protein